MEKRPPPPPCPLAALGNGSPLLTIPGQDSGGGNAAKDPLSLQFSSPVNATKSRCARDSPYHPGDLLHPPFWLSLDPPTRSPLEVWGRRLGTSRLNSRPEPQTRELRLDNQEPRPGAGEERGNGDTTRKQGHTKMGRGGGVCVWARTRGRTSGAGNGQSLLQDFPVGRGREGKKRRGQSDPH